MTAANPTEEAVLNHLASVPRHADCAEVAEIARATRLPVEKVRRAVLSLETHGVVCVLRTTRRASLRGRNPVRGASGWKYTVLTVYLPPNSPYRNNQ